MIDDEDDDDDDVMDSQARAKARAMRRGGAAGGRRPWRWCDGVDGCDGDDDGAMAIQDAGR